MSGPRPGIRALGCFSETDTFIALTWNYRENIDWEDEVNKCRSAWIDLFGTVPPHKGSTIYDYISYGVQAA